MTVDRKAVRHNLLSLMECGYEIEYSETVRTVTNPKTGEEEESYIWSDFYLERDFSDSELRLLIDGLLFSRHIPYSDCKNLVEKLKNLSNVYFNSHIKHIARMPDDKPITSICFLTLSFSMKLSANRKRSALTMPSIAQIRKCT